jgi:hypothetical protein
MRAYRFFLVAMLCSIARVASAQLTARDSTALVDAIAERIITEFGTGAAREPFVMVPHIRATPVDVRFTTRLSAAIQARDSSLIIAVPLRSTRRIVFEKIELVAGDTAAVTFSVAWCKGTPPIFGSHNAPLAFRRVGDHWTYVERNVGGSGTANNGCPW